METVGIRELKNHLSRHLKRVRSGARLAVANRGRPVATLSPVEAPPGTAWANELVEAGLAHWNGGKPTGSSQPLVPLGSRERSVSAVVLEQRR
jgi:prevent-host-death family protein